MTDDYDLPDSLLGPLPTWFFPAIGRVVAVSSLVENKAQVLAETLARVPQDTLTLMTTAIMKKVACKAAKQIDQINADRSADPVGHQIEDFFDRVQRMLDRRNGVVHSIWPAQAGDEQFGWRPGRGRRGEATRVTPDRTLKDMKDLIRSGSDIVLDWNRLHASANAALMVALASGYQGLGQDPIIGEALKP